MSDERTARGDDKVFDEIDRRWPHPCPERTAALALTEAWRESDPRLDRHDGWGDIEDLNPPGVIAVVMAALEAKGFTTARLEQVGWRCTWRDMLDAFPADQSWLAPEPSDDPDVVSVAVFRVVTEETRP